MLIIRLQRVGKKNEPTFRVVLTDSKNGPKSGKYLEVLGSYDARDKNITKIDGEKILEWISKGAQVSDTMHNILINQKVIDGKKINVLPKKSPIINEEAKKAEEEVAAAAAEGAKDAEEPVAEKKQEEVTESNEVVEEAKPAEEKTGEAPAPSAEEDKEA